MGSIYKRGTRAQARYYLHYRVGKKDDGSPRYEMRAAKGARTMEDARKQLAAIEARIGQGMAPVPEEQVLPSKLRPLFERWRDGLDNRSADDDRSRIDRHLLPRFGDLTIEVLTLAEVMNWLDDLKKTTLSGQSRLSVCNARLDGLSGRRGAPIGPVRLIQRRGSRRAQRRNRQDGEPRCQGRLECGPPPRALP